MSLADDGQCDVSYVREDLRGAAAAHAATVFCEGHVTDVEQPVFDMPMLAREIEQLIWSMALRRQAGDGVDHLALAKG